MSTSDSALNRIDHIVVLMLENRSFDNVLGWLYDPENKRPFDKVPREQTFEGVSGKLLCNPRPGGGDLFTGDACVGKGTSMIDPFPDPNEPYDSVYAQMYNDHTNPARSQTEPIRQAWTASLSITLRRSKRRGQRRKAVAEYYLRSFAARARWLPIRA